MKFSTAILLVGGATAALIKAPEQQHTLAPQEDGSEQWLPWVNSRDLRRTMRLSNLISRAYDLYDIAGLSKAQWGRHTRVIGSLGHEGTVNYVYNTLKKLGGYYDVWTQDFYVVNGYVRDSRLVLGREDIEAVPMRLTPPTPGGKAVRGRLVLTRNEGCDLSDYPRNAKGAIVLIKRGTCSFSDKSENARRSGAIAAVIYNNERGRLSGTLGSLGQHVPTLGITAGDAQPYIDQLRRGYGVDGSILLDSVLERIKTTNVLAETRDGDPDNVVMLGAHSDSVSTGPGINDDGSGTITLLELAVQLSKFRVRNKVRFAWWAAEEEGLLGSAHYALTLPPEENRRIRLFMDYDMMASPNYAFQVYDGNNRQIRGNEELRDMYIDYYESQGLNWTTIPFDGRSDYAPFLVVGIPAGGVATGAEGVKTTEEQEMFGGKAGEWYDQCYHQHCDDLSNLDEFALEVNAGLIAHSVATYADSLRYFPPRAPPQRPSDSWLNFMTHGKLGSQSTNLPPMKYRGPHLVY